MKWDIKPHDLIKYILGEYSYNIIPMLGEPRRWNTS